MAQMEVILKTKVAGLGAEADVVSVRRGFGRNFLIPQGKAYEATKPNLRHMETLKRQRAEREAKEMADAEKIVSKIKKLKLKLELATGQGGKAFGSITVNDLVAAVKDHSGIELDRHTIKLDKPIKATGKFDVPVKLHPEISVDLRLTVVAKGDEGQDEAAE